MRQYELALVIASNFAEDKVKLLQGKIEEFIKGEKGKITKKDAWPKRVLAYPINKEKEAQLLFLNFDAPTLSKGFNQKIKLTQGILRYLLLKE